MDYIESAEGALAATMGMGPEFMMENPELVSAGLNVAMLGTLIDIAQSLRRWNFEAVVQGGKQD